MYWLISVLAGCALGVLLYGCVRVRMAMGPWLRQRFGNGARRAWWALTIVVMVGLSNLALWELRDYLLAGSGADSVIGHEAVFALVSFALAGALIAREVRPRS